MESRPHQKGGGGPEGTQEVSWGWLGSVGVGWGRFGSVRIGSDRFGSVRIGSDARDRRLSAFWFLGVPPADPKGRFGCGRVAADRCGSPRIAADRADGCLENLVGAGVCLDAPNRPNDTKETFTWTSRTFKR